MTRGEKSNGLREERRNDKGKKCRRDEGKSVEWTREKVERVEGKNERIRGNK